MSMKEIIANIKKNSKTEIIIINLIIQFYVFRVTLPFLKYPFILLFLYMIINILFFTKREVLVKSVKEFFKDYSYILLVLLIYLISFIISNKIYLTVFKGVFNAIILCSFFFILNIKIKKKQLNDFLKIFIYTLNILTIFIIVFNLIIKTGIIKNYFYTISKIDYNFALIPTIFSFISILYFLADTKANSFIKFIYNVLLNVYSIQILFSTSRRGIFILLVIMTIILIAQITTLFSKKRLIVRFAKLTRYYILTLVVLITMIFLVVNISSCVFKNTVVDKFGERNSKLIKKSIALSLYRYSDIVGNKKNFNEVYNSIWSSDYNPIDPSCGWGFRNCKKIYPLTGTNSEIVPEDAIGCYIDSLTFQPNKVNKNVLLFKVPSENNMNISSKIYCYVSEDFDGERVSLMVDWKAVNSKLVKNRPLVHYDLNRKETWQCLEINIECNEGIIPIYLSVFKTKERISKGLKGHVIIAYPTYNKNLSSNVSDLKLNSYEKLRLKKAINRENKQNINLNNNLTIYKSTLGFNSLFQLMNSPTEIKEDHIRYLTSKFISEDTTFLPYENELAIDTISSKLIGPRINRWKFAWQIFSKEYNWAEKIIGGGFDHLNWYGFYFHNDKSRSDWPHNPFISVLLYSGLIGFIIFLFTEYRAIRLYLKYIKGHSIFFIFFIISFFFSFFSADSPFNPPIMGFLLIFPFFIHSVYKRDKQNNEVDVNNKEEPNG